MIPSGERDPYRGQQSNYLVTEDVMHPNRAQTQRLFLQSSWPNTIPEIYLQSRLKYFYSSSDLSRSRRAFRFQSPILRISAILQSPSLRVSAVQARLGNWQETSRPLCAEPTSIPFPQSSSDPSSRQKLRQPRDGFRLCPILGHLYRPRSEHKCRP
jgi:hypothetical protein